jgi:hypothetical protein
MMKRIMIIQYRKDERYDMECTYLSIAWNHHSIRTLFHFGRLPWFSGLQARIENFLRPTIAAEMRNMFDNHPSTPLLPRRLEQWVFHNSDLND